MGKIVFVREGKVKHANRKMPSGQKIEEFAHVVMDVNDRGFVKIFSLDLFLFFSYAYFSVFVFIWIWSFSVRFLTTLRISHLLFQQLLTKYNAPCPSVPVFIQFCTGD